jgi:hypothetical protein
MRRTTARLSQVLGFFALVAVVNQTLGATRARANVFNAVVDSIAGSTGMRSEWVDLVLIGLMAFGILRLLMGLSHTLARMMKG